MRLSTIVNAITLVFLLVLAMGLALHTRQIHWTAARIVGGAIIAGSMVLAMVARLQLGESFSVSAKARKLVTTGLYARIRNPIYLSGELLFVGICDRIVALGGASGSRRAGAGADGKGEEGRAGVERGLWGGIRKI
jgi:protein-S-isoprenylcysteine O-methyltransferase Ste14